MSDTSGSVDMYSVTESADTSDVSFDDVPYRCEICQAPLTYGGRGRKPTRCTEHKRSASTGTKRKSASMEGLKQSIAGTYTFIGTGVMWVDQFDGTVICQSADQLAEAWIALAQADPKWKKRLERFFTGSSIGQLVFAHLLVALPIMQHHDMLPSFMKAQDKTNA